MMYCIFLLFDYFRSQIGCSFINMDTYYLFINLWVLLHLQVFLFLR